ncbi:hypothetical protein DTO271D3_8054 [Paecilomyces variotii]|nr:hypothetical protein DTO271D3_8054 [Paecilomyces variotii]
MSVPQESEDEALDIHDPYLWLPSRYNGHIFRLRGSEERWQCGPILREGVRHTRTDFDDVSEVCGICNVTLLDGAQAGLKAMLKIHVQIPDGRDTRDELYPGRDYSKFRSEELSWEAETEFVMLEHLTKKGCKSVPHLIGYSVDKQPKDGYVPGGYIVYVIMEKVPGHDLWDFGKYPLEKRDQIRIAFGKAIREFYLHGCQHLDPRRSNVIWDEATNRCWIVDMEHVDFADPPVKFKPFREWSIWGLSRQEVMDNTDDETVVCSVTGTFFSYCNGETEVETKKMQHEWEGRMESADSLKTVNAYHQQYSSMVLEISLEGNRQLNTQSESRYLS